MADEKKCPCDPMTQALEDLKKHDERLYQGDSNFKLINFKLDTMKEDVVAIRADVKCLTDKPGKRYEGIVDKVIDRAIGLGSLGIMAYIADLLLSK